VIGRDGSEPLTGQHCVTQDFEFSISIVRRSVGEVDRWWLVG
jgi:hypothetical protein